jgi:hypothetical protein
MTELLKISSSLSPLSHLFLNHMTAPYWIASHSSALSNHAMISHSLPSARLLSFPTIIHPEDGNCNVCGYRKFTTRYRAYSQKFYING